MNRRSLLIALVALIFTPSFFLPVEALTSVAPASTVSGSTQTSEVQGPPAPPANGGEGPPAPPKDTSTSKSKSTSKEQKCPAPSGKTGKANTKGNDDMSANTSCKISSTKNYYTLPNGTKCLQGTTEMTSMTGQSCTKTVNGQTVKGTCTGDNECTASVSGLVGLRAFGQGALAPDGQKSDSVASQLKDKTINGASTPLSSDQFNQVNQVNDLTNNTKPAFTGNDSPQYDPTYGPQQQSDLYKNTPPESPFSFESQSPVVQQFGQPSGITPNVDSLAQGGVSIGDAAGSDLFRPAPTADQPFNPFTSDLRGDFGPPASIGPNDIGPSSPDFTPSESPGGIPGSAPILPSDIAVNTPPSTFPQGDTSGTPDTGGAFVPQNSSPVVEALNAAKTDAGNAVVALRQAEQNAATSLGDYLNNNNPSTQTSFGENTNGGTSQNSVAFLKTAEARLQDTLTNLQDAANLVSPETALGCQMKPTSCLTGESYSGIPLNAINGLPEYRIGAVGSGALSGIGVTPGEILGNPFLNTQISPLAMTMSDTWAPPKGPPDESGNGVPVAEGSSNPLNFTDTNKIALNTGAELVPGISGTSPSTFSIMNQANAAEDQGGSGPSSVFLNKDGGDWNHNLTITPEGLPPIVQATDHLGSFSGQPSESGTPSSPTAADTTFGPAPTSPVVQQAGSGVLGETAQTGNNPIESNTSPGWGDLYMAKVAQGGEVQGPPEAQGPPSPAFSQGNSIPLPPTRPAEFGSNAEVPNPSVSISGTSPVAEQFGNPSGLNAGDTAVLGQGADSSYKSTYPTEITTPGDKAAAEALDKTRAAYATLDATHDPVLAEAKAIYDKTNDNATFLQAANEKAIQDVDAAVAKKEQYILDHSKDVVLDSKGNITGYKFDNADLPEAQRLGKAVDTALGNYNSTHDAFVQAIKDNEVATRDLNQTITDAHDFINQIPADQVRLAEIGARNEEIKAQLDSPNLGQTPSSGLFDSSQSQREALYNELNRNNAEATVIANDPNGKAIGAYLENSSYGPMRPEDVIARQEVLKSVYKESADMGGPNVSESGSGGVMSYSGANLGTQIEAAINRVSPELAAWVGYKSPADLAKLDSSWAQQAMGAIPATPEYKAFLDSSLGNTNTFNKVSWAAYDGANNWASLGTKLLNSDNVVLQGIGAGSVVMGGTIAGIESSGLNLLSKIPGLGVLPPPDVQSAQGMQSGIQNFTGVVADAAVIGSLGGPAAYSAVSKVAGDIGSATRSAIDTVAAPVSMEARNAPSFSAFERADGTIGLRDTTYRPSNDVAINEPFATNFQGGSVSLDGAPETLANLPKLSERLGVNLDSTGAVESAPVSAPVEVTGVSRPVSDFAVNTEPNPTTGVTDLASPREGGVPANPGMLAQERSVASAVDTGPTLTTTQERAIETINNKASSRGVSSPDVKLSYDALVKDVTAQNDLSVSFKNDIPSDTITNRNGTVVARMDPASGRYEPVVPVEQGPVNIDRGAVMQAQIQADFERLTTGSEAISTQEASRLLNEKYSINNIESPSAASDLSSAPTTGSTPLQKTLQAGLATLNIVNAVPAIAQDIGAALFRNPAPITQSLGQNILRSSVTDLSAVRAPIAAESPFRLTGEVSPVAVTPSSAASAVPALFGTAPFTSAAALMAQPAIATPANALASAGVSPSGSVLANAPASPAATVPANNLGPAASVSHNGSPSVNPSTGTGAPASPAQPTSQGTTPASIGQTTPTSPTRGGGEIVSPATNTPSPASAQTNPALQPTVFAASRSVAPTQSWVVPGEHTFVAVVDPATGQTTTYSADQSAPGTGTPVLEKSINNPADRQAFLDGSAARTPIAPPSGMTPRQFAQSIPQAFNNTLSQGVVPYNPLGGAISSLIPVSGYTPGANSNDFANKMLLNNTGLTPTDVVALRNQLAAQQIGWAPGFGDTVSSFANNPLGQIWQAASKAVNAIASVITSPTQAAPTVAQNPQNPIGSTQGITAGKPVTVGTPAVPGLNQGLQFIASTQKSASDLLQKAQDTADKGNVQGALDTLNQSLDQMQVLGKAAYDAGVKAGNNPLQDNGINLELNAHETQAQLVDDAKAGPITDAQPYLDKANLTFDNAGDLAAQVGQPATQAPAPATPGPVASGEFAQPVDQVLNHSFTDRVLAGLQDPFGAIFPHAIADPFVAPLPPRRPPDLSGAGAVTPADTIIIKNLTQAIDALCGASVCSDNILALKGSNGVQAFKAYVESSPKMNDTEIQQALHLIEDTALKNTKKPQIPALETFFQIKFVLNAPGNNPNIDSQVGPWLLVAREIVAQQIAQQTPLTPHDKQIADNMGQATKGLNPDEARAKIPLDPVPFPRDLPDRTLGVSSGAAKTATYKDIDTIALDALSRYQKVIDSFYDAHGRRHVPITLTIYDGPSTKVLGTDISAGRDQGSFLFPKNYDVYLDRNEIRAFNEYWSPLTTKESTRYTLAHEIGHLIGQDLGLRNKIFNSSSLAGREYPQAVYDEWLADTIAGALMSEAGLLEKGDPSDLYHLWASIPGRVVTHGPPLERAKVVYQGLASGDLDKALHFISGIEPDWQYAFALPPAKITIAPVAVSEVLPETLAAFKNSLPGFKASTAVPLPVIIINESGDIADLPNDYVPPVSSVTKSTPGIPETQPQGNIGPVSVNGEFAQPTDQAPGLLARLTDPNNWLPIGSAVAGPVSPLPSVAFSNPFVAFPTPAQLFDTLGKIPSIIGQAITHPGDTFAKIRDAITSPFRPVSPLAVTPAPAPQTSKAIDPVVLTTISNVTKAMAEVWGAKPSDVQALAQATAAVGMQEARLDPKVFHPPTKSGLPSLYQGSPQTSPLGSAENGLTLRFLATNPYLNISDATRQVFKDLADRYDALLAARIDPRTDPVLGPTELVAQMWNLPRQSDSTATKEAAQKYEALMQADRKRSLNETQFGTQLSDANLNQGGGLSGALVAAEYARRPDGTIDPLKAASVLMATQLSPASVQAYVANKNATLTKAGASAFSSNSVKIAAGDPVTKAFDSIYNSRTYKNNFTAGIAAQTRSIGGIQPTQVAQNTSNIPLPPERPANLATDNTNAPLPPVKPAEFGPQSFGTLIAPEPTAAPGPTDFASDINLQPLNGANSAAFRALSSLSNRALFTNDNVSPLIAQQGQPTASPSGVLGQAGSQIDRANADVALQRARDEVARLAAAQQAANTSKPIGTLIAPEGVLQSPTPQLTQQNPTAPTTIGTSPTIRFVDTVTAQQTLPTINNPFEGKSVVYNGTQPSFLPQLTQPAVPLGNPLANKVLGLPGLPGTIPSFLPTLTSLSGPSAPLPPSRPTGVGTEVAQNTPTPPIKPADLNTQATPLPPVKPTLGTQVAQTAPLPPVHPADLMRDFVKEGIGPVMGTNPTVSNVVLNAATQSGAHVIFDSGKLTPAENAAAGNLPTSQHLTGNAIEVRVPASEAPAFIQAVRAAFNALNGGHGGIGYYGVDADGNALIQIDTRTDGRHIWGPGDTTASVIPDDIGAQQKAFQNGQNPGDITPVNDITAPNTAPAQTTRAISNPSSPAATPAAPITLEPSVPDVAPTVVAPDQVAPTIIGRVEDDAVQQSLAQQKAMYDAQQASRSSLQKLVDVLSPNGAWAAIPIHAADNTTLEQGAVNLVGEADLACRGLGFDPKSCVALVMAIYGAETDQLNVDVVSSVGALNIGQIMPANAGPLYKILSQAPAFAARFPGINSSDAYLSALQGNMADHGWRATVWGTVAHFTFDNPSRTNTGYQIAYRYNHAGWYASGITQGMKDVLAGGTPRTANDPAKVGVEKASISRTSPLWNAVAGAMRTYVANGGAMAPVTVNPMAAAQVNAHNQMADAFNRPGGTVDNTVHLPTNTRGIAVVNATPVAPPAPAVDNSALKTSFANLQTSAKAAADAGAQAKTLSDASEYSGALRSTLQALQSGTNLAQAAGEIADKVGDRQLKSDANGLKAQINQIAPTVQSGISNPLSLLSIKDSLATNLTQIAASGESIAARAQQAAKTKLAAAPAPAPVVTSPTAPVPTTISADQAIKQSIASLQKVFGCNGVSCNTLRIIDTDNPQGQGMTPEMAQWIKNRYAGASKSVSTNLRAAVIMSDYTACTVMGGSCGTVTSAAADRSSEGTHRHPGLYAIDTSFGNGNRTAQSDYVSSFINAAHELGITPGIGIGPSSIHADTIGAKISSGAANAWAYGPGATGGDAASANLDSIADPRLNQIGKAALAGEVVSANLLPSSKVTVAGAQASAAVVAPAPAPISYRPVFTYNGSGASVAPLPGVGIPNDFAAYAGISPYAKETIPTAPSAETPAPAPSTPVTAGPAAPLSPQVTEALRSVVAAQQDMQSTLTSAQKAYQDGDVKKALTNVFQGITKTSALGSQVGALANATNNPSLQSAARIFNAKALKAADDIRTAENNPAVLKSYFAQDGVISSVIKDGQALTQQAQTIAQGSAPAPTVAATPAPAPTPAAVPAAPALPSLDNLPVRTDSLYQKPLANLTQAELKKITNDTINSLNQYWQTQFSQRGMTYTPAVVVWIQSGNLENVATIQQYIRVPVNIGEILSGSFTVPSNFLLAFFSHEVSHNAMAQLGLQPTRPPADPGVILAIENMADMLSGTSMRGAIDVNGQSLLHQGDLQQMFSHLKKYPGDPVHSTGPERVALVQSGIQSGSVDATLSQVGKKANWGPVTQPAVAVAPPRTEVPQVLTEGPNATVRDATPAEIASLGLIGPDWNAGRPVGTLTFAPATTPSADVTQNTPASAQATVQSPADITGQNILDQITNRLMNLIINNVISRLLSLRRSSGNLAQPLPAQQTAGDNAPPPDQTRTALARQVTAVQDEMAAARERVVAEYTTRGENFNKLSASDQARVLDNDPTYYDAHTRLNNLNTRQQQLVVSVARENNLPALLQKALDNPKTTYGALFGVTWLGTTLFGGGSAVISGTPAAATPANAAPIVGAVRAPLFSLQPLPTLVPDTNNPDNPNNPNAPGGPAPVVPGGPGGPSTRGPGVGGSPSNPGYPSGNPFGGTGFGNSMSPLQQAQMQQAAQQAAQQNAPYGTGTDGQPCNQPPAQPTTSCPVGTSWQSVSATGNGCVTSWQCGNIANTTGTPPTLSFYAVPQTILVNASTTLMWTSTNTTACYVFDAAGKFLTQGTQSGQYPISTLATTTPFSMTCTSYGYGQNIYASTTVMVSTSTPATATPTYTNE